MDTILVFRSVVVLLEIFITYLKNRVTKYELYNLLSHSSVLIYPQCCQLIHQWLGLGTKHFCLTLNQYLLHRQICFPSLLISIFSKFIPSNMSNSFYIEFIIGIAFWSFVMMCAFFCILEPMVSVNYLFIMPLTNIIKHIKLKLVISHDWVEISWGI